ncbi:MAG TPA: hypothetical protein VES88_00575 [Gemmatimonadaceae bacterium]|nr:hypothetical protein [Gemmatimonadaceae bacterium]
MTKSRYRSVDETKIIETLERLRNRIGERFPESGLYQVSEELIAVARETSECVEYIRSPHWPVRIVTGAAVTGMAVVVLLVVTWTSRLPAGIREQADAVQVIDATASASVFIGLAILFLLRIEPSLKRRQALRVAHQLRSLAHVIDMHQLTKDPERLMSPEIPDTSSSPGRTMNASQLGRYLDYCSELLSVTSKLSALLVQYFNDPVLLGAVNEIETLTTGLSRKIWQKIQLLDNGRIAAGA